MVSRDVGDTIGADNFLPNMGTEEFLPCLSLPALEGVCENTSLQPRQKVKDTRTALVEHFNDGRFVHASALFAPDEAKLTSWLKRHEPKEQADDAGMPTETDEFVGMRDH